MKEQILEKLTEIQDMEDITILYAAEIGSRAWGHNNENSDYDIRFIYKHKDISKYLVMDKFEDVIHFEDEIFDLTGWDIKKALNLHFKSNPNLREWLISPMVYVENQNEIFKGLPDFTPEIIKNHYYGLAYKTNKKYIEGKDLRDKKIVKKTLYVIRCNLAWQVLDKGVLPQMDIFQLMEESGMSDDLKSAVLKLRQAYSNLKIENVSDEELEMIHTWIVESFESFERKPFKAPKRDIEQYNERFQEILGLR